MMIDNSIIWISIVLLAGMLFVMMCSLIAFIIYTFKREDKYYIHIDFKKIKQDLDDLIIEASTQYMQMRPNLMGEDSYIKSEDMKIITTEIVAKVMSNITPIMRHNLELVYNINTDADLVNIIADKVMIIVINLTANINSAIPQEFSTIL